jgi:hypothetical protein
MYFYIGALQRDMPVLVEALAADFKEVQTQQASERERERETYEPTGCCGLGGKCRKCGKPRAEHFTPAMYCIDSRNLAAEGPGDSRNLAAEGPGRLLPGVQDQMQLKKLKELEAQISRDFDALSTDLATPGKISWY